MRVSSKLTVGISVVSLLIAGAHGWRQMVQERKDLRGAIERDLRTVGNAVQVSLEHALRDRQYTDIQGALDSLEGIAPDLDLFVFAPEGGLRARSIGSVDEPILRTFAARAASSRQPVLEIDAEQAWRATLGLPLVDDEGHDAGALVLVQPLVEVRRDLVDTRRGILVSLCILVIALTGVQALLGTLWVTRPLSALASGMQRLREGRPPHVAGTRRNDEVGRLGKEFDALVADLRVARDRIAREVESRLALEQGLQRVDKLVTIGQLSAGLAHEIGSPLQVMSGRARALMARSTHEDEVRKNAAVLADQSDRIARIVERLLLFGQRRTPRMAETDLAAPVRTVLDLMEPSARRRGISVAFQCPPEPPRVVADVDQIQQVALNLLKNALAATRDGGHISIRVGPGRIESPDGPIPAARLEIEDDGCGMTEDVRARLFEPFFTTRENEGGTGLGLPVVQSIVRAHGGSLGVVTSPGSGTKFTIDLPAQGASA
ncbi:MAG TPA: HAMP domain-containing sensor histidine kinase [Candidatus Polarisedimenticolaceae bacterium]|nr:HAMP domain-containing sensor histidine kinase [Candidatus Polarisedimenticolaceae bacterium]